MNNARTIPLKFGAIGVTRLTVFAARAIRPIFEQRDASAVRSPSSICSRVFQFALIYPECIGTGDFG